MSNIFSHTRRPRTCLPYAEGWHAADHGHIHACPYDSVDEAADRAEWAAGWTARWSHLHPQSDGAPWTTGR